MRFIACGDDLQQLALSILPNEDAWGPARTGTDLHFGPSPFSQFTAVGLVGIRSLVHWSPPLFLQGCSDLSVGCSERDDWNRLALRRQMNASQKCGQRNGNDLFMIHHGDRIDLH